jgi:protein O-GlcNAc transferase
MAADRIDVLVELSALFPESRIPLLARRTVPIQATLPQCPTTTGCRGVDYLFTDRWTSPPGTEGEYAERLHYLASGHVIYTPPATCPPPRPVPALTIGSVTFGLLQRFMKIGADVWDAVAEVLRAVSGSRLLLHNGDQELDRPESATRAYCGAQLSARDVDPGRLSFAGPISHVAHLDLINGIDLALDTWPYSGTTTTCECLWMGVPVVTLAGRTHASRVSAALLRRCGLDGLVATDRQAYIRIASDLARDVDRLRVLRATLRERAVASGLTDGRALAAGMEAAYETWVGRRG